MNRVLEACVRLWELLRDVAMVLRPCRFSAIVVAGGVALLLSGQGLEFTVRLPAEDLGKTVWFDACVFFWAFQSWYWARLMLDLTFGDRDAPLDHPRADRVRRIILQTPRVLAAASYLVAVAVCLHARTWMIGVPLLLEGILFYAFLVLRVGLVRRLAGNAPTWKRALLVREGDPRSLRSMSPVSKLILWVTLACAVASTIWVCVDAVGFGWTFGTAAVPFLGFSVLVPGGSLLVLWASARGGTAAFGQRPQTFPDTSAGLPVISMLLIVALAFSFFPAFDNHAVRTLPQAEPARPVRLNEALDRWQAQAPGAGDGRPNLVVVATAGGGLRAAYWTATVLGAIQDRTRTFNRHLFAVSGVSGGSLGATVFATLVSGKVSLSDRSSAGCEAGGRRMGRVECDGQTVLSEDFLAPAVAALLFPDLMQRFFPVGFPDRAKALEQSWERAWLRAGFTEDPWTGRGFRSLWAGEGYVPALLLNSTHVESGKRVIASNLDIGAEAKVFRDAYDLYALLPAGSEIRPSTAAHTSARFTYVSPAGTLADGTHLVDGGYFENFGAVTAREALKAAVDRFGKKIRPVAILISNDPELGEGDLPSSDPRQPGARARETWAAEALSPIRALLHTRDARGLLAASELRAFAEENGGDYFQFRLCREAGHPDPALGWVLSDESEDQMRRQMVSSACGNAEQLKALVETLRG